MFTSQQTSPGTTLKHQSLQKLTFCSHLFHVAGFNGIITLSNLLGALF